MSKSYNKDWCNHYNGLSDVTLGRREKCEAGVRYDDVAIKEGSYINWKRPCFTRDGVKDRCPMAEYATREQIAETDKAIAALLNRTLVARQAIVAASKGRRNTSGRLACPVCHDGLLVYEVHYNGHIHARCNTANCVNWME